MKSFVRLLFAFCLFTAVGPAVAEPVQLEVELLSDRWHYPFNFTPGVRQNAPLFILNATDAESFNRRDGMAIVQWSVAPPESMSGPFDVVEARIRFWDRKQAGYVLGSLSPSGVVQRIELFAARFDAPFGESSWTGTEPYVGGGVGSATGAAPRNPYPIDLATGDHVENEVFTSVPWAVGTADSYTPGAMTDAFPIEFELDASDPRIQAELQGDVAAGRSSWFFSATFEIDAVDASQVPQALMSESVLNTGFGVSQQPPELILRIEQKPSSAAGWSLYE